MKNPRSNALLLVGSLFLTSLICAAPARAGCDKSGIGPEYGVVCLSLQKDDNGNPVIVVDPGTLELQRGDKNPGKVRWQVSDDADSKSVKWRIKWKKTYKVVKGQDQEISNYDPFSKGGLHPHRRTIPASAPGADAGNVVTDRAKGLGDYPQEIKWAYSVAAKIDGDWKVLDPIILFPGGGG